MCNNFLPSRSIRMYLGLVLFSTLLAGCSTLTNQSIRSVKDNVFYSTAQPKLKVSVGRDYKYIGVEKNHVNFDKNTRMKQETYHFTSYDKNLQ